MARVESEGIFSIEKLIILIVYVQFFHAKTLLDGPRQIRRHLFNEKLKFEFFIFNTSIPKLLLLARGEGEIHFFAREDRPPTNTNLF